MILKNKMIIKARTENKLSPGATLELEDKDITKDKSENKGGKISSYAIFKGNVFQSLWGGAEIVHYEIRINVIQGADSNHPTKCEMMVTHKAKCLQI